MSNPTIIQFQPFTTFIDPSFWQQFGKQKLEKHRTENPLLAITGQYHAQHRPSSDHGVTIHVSSDLVMPLNIDGNALEKTIPLDGKFAISGSIQNTGTMEEFKTMNKKDLFNAAASEIWSNVVSGKALKQPALLFKFIVLSFSNLKSFKYYYIAGIPALSPAEPFMQEGPMSSICEEFSSAEISKIADLYSKDLLNDPAFLIIRDRADVSMTSLSSITSINLEESKVYISFWDPSPLRSNPGWLLRNILFLLKYHLPDLKDVSVLCLKKTVGVAADFTQSRIIRVKCPDCGFTSYNALGWEKNKNGKIAPKLIDLSPSMDPRILAETAVDLNLKLMRWRAMPTCNIEKLRGTKCLLLGAGTLGCNVARCLMGWGVRHITFVDNGTVSYSNPVRQSLYNFDDCIERSYKATAAASRLTQIFPGMKSQGVVLTIPMPGHRVDKKIDIENQVKQLTELISQHDVVFLLTDSRESRWLPTLLCNAQSKITLNMALGFDSYLIMRHGIPGSDLGCYFCNDVVAPTDSMTGRLLDQQCTITRPGASYIASAIGVELMVALLHHPEGALASCDSSDESPFGPVAHQIRGDLWSFSQLKVQGQRYEKCTACSASILEKYRTDSFDFISNVIDDPKYLEATTGLKELHQETLDGMLEWDNDEIDDETSI